MAQAIQRQLEEIEVKHKELENQGVTLEKALRGEDSSMNSLHLFDFLQYFWDISQNIFILLWADVLERWFS